MRSEIEPVFLMPQPYADGTQLRVCELRCGRARNSGSHIHYRSPNSLASDFFEPMPASSRNSVLADGSSERFASQMVERKKQLR